MRPIRVVLAEDDPSDRLLVEAHFARQPDLELCAAARDGFEALELVARERLDFLLLDLVMPGLDGLEVLRKLGEQPPQRRPGVVVTSRVGSSRVTDLCIHLGASYFAIKPLNMASLFSLLRALHRDVLREKALDLLVQMGAQRDHLSVRQTAQTAAALARDPTQTMLLKQAYYDSIVESGSTWIRVEKNIRAVIRSIHQAGSPLYRTLLETAALADQPPSNRVFLWRLAVRLRG